jgi:hypothetical protein
MGDHGRPDGQMKAYAVFDSRDNPDAGLKRMRIVDFQSLEGDRPLRPLLKCSLIKCRREEPHILEKYWLLCCLQQRFPRLRRHRTTTDGCRAGSSLTGRTTRN